MSFWKIDKAIFRRNALKSFAVFFSLCFLFVATITFFPLMASVYSEDYPLMRVLAENFSLLIPLSIGCAVLSPLFGFLTTRIKKFRRFWLILAALAGYWLTLFIIMAYYAGFEFGSDDAAVLFLLSIWAIAAYSVFIVPMLVGAVFWLEWWTRK
jgi:hypothetical protein